jgi:hypothetical protein
MIALRERRLALANNTQSTARMGGTLSVTVCASTIKAGWTAIADSIQYSTYNKLLKVQRTFIDDDFLGAEDFHEFKRLIKAGALHGLFPTWPFGDDGLEPPGLLEALRGALKHFGLAGQANIEDKPFNRPEMANNALGLACIVEDTHDTLGHWVALIGNEHLEDTGIVCGPNWNWIILDSDRGYERWRVDSNARRPRIEIRHQAETRATPIERLYSFVSVLL